MEENIRTIRERVRDLDALIGPRFGWRSNLYDDYSRYVHKEREQPVKSAYDIWVENIESYNVIARQLNDEMCTSTIRNKNTNELVTVSHSLGDVLHDMSGTPIEDEFRRCMMLCIYTDLDIKISIRPYLLQLYG